MTFGPSSSSISTTVKGLARSGPCARRGGPRCSCAPDLVRSPRTTPGRRPDNPGNRAGGVPYAVAGLTALEGDPTSAGGLPVGLREWGLLRYDPGAVNATVHEARSTAWGLTRRARL